MIELNKEVRERIDQSVRIRTFVWLLLAVSLALSVALIVMASRFFSTYQDLELAMDEYDSSRDAMLRLEDGSAYLTQKVREYAVTGDVEQMEDYFQEVETTRRRDTALAILQNEVKDPALLEKAHDAMEASNELMLLEYRVMRLRAEGDGIPEEDMHPDIQNVMLMPEDLDLTPEEYKEKAIALAFGPEYDLGRETIDHSIHTFFAGLVSEMGNHQKESSEHLQLVQRLTYGLIIVFFGVVCIAFAVVARLVILPLIRSTRLVERQRLLPVAGSREMRLLAANYNHILEKHLAKQEQLVYANEHDSLTGAYSRAVFDRFCADPGEGKPIAMMLADLDYFKRINDSYGHNMGDRILKRAAELLIGAFRSGDLVCRIGGDEFSAVLFNITPAQKALLEEKLLAVEDSLKNPVDEELPPCSLSIGIAFGDARDARELHVNADTAMYRAKKAGRGTVVFF